MKKIKTLSKIIIYLLPFILFILLRICLWNISVNHSFWIISAGTLLAGVIMNFSKCIGALCGMSTAIYIYILGTQNWMTNIETVISYILFIFYLFLLFNPFKLLKKISKIG